MKTYRHVPSELEEKSEECFSAGLGGSDLLTGSALGTL